MTGGIVVIGAGMGGLTAAARLARDGFRVRVLEANPFPGGLASSFEADGLLFDAGPCILLDRPGLEWAFSMLDLELDQHVALRRIEHVYEVTSDHAPPVVFSRDVEQPLQWRTFSWLLVSHALKRNPGFSQFSRCQPRGNVCRVAARREPRIRRGPSGRSGNNGAVDSKALEE